MHYIKIRVFNNVKGTVKNAIEAFKKGKLKKLMKSKKNKV